MEAHESPAAPGPVASGAQPVQELLALMQGLVAIALRSVELAAPSVTLPQFRALLVLERVGPCNGGELAEQLGTHPSSVTRICDRLVHLDCVTRTLRPENRRQVVLDVTASGRALVASVQGHRERELLRLLEGMPARARSQLAGGLPDLLAALEREHEALPGGWAH